MIDLDGIYLKEKLNLLGGCCKLGLVKLVMLVSICSDESVNSMFGYAMIHGINMLELYLNSDRCYIYKINIVQMISKARRLDKYFNKIC